MSTVNVLADHAHSEAGPPEAEGGIYKTFHFSDATGYSCCFPRVFVASDMYVILTALGYFWIW